MLSGLVLLHKAEIVVGEVAEKVLAVFQPVLFPVFMLVDLVGLKAGKAVGFPNWQNTGQRFHGDSLGL